MLALGFLLMIVNKVASLALPLSSRWLVDNVIGSIRPSCLGRLFWGCWRPPAFQGATSFGSRSCSPGGAAADRGAAAQGAGAHRPPAGGVLRRQQERHAGFAHHDGRGRVRNLLGTGLVDFVGGVLLALLSLGVLLWTSPLLTAIALASISVFALVLLKAFGRIRPIFRERGKINAEVTGRLTECAGGRAGGERVPRRGRGGPRVFGARGGACSRT